MASSAFIFLLISALLQQRNMLDAEMLEIFDMCNENGFLAILDEARWQFQYPGRNSASPVQRQPDRDCCLDCGQCQPLKTVIIRITYPNSCSLKYDELDLRLRDMLKASGIEQKEPMTEVDAEKETSEATLG
jgi:hypothetical protein